MGQNLGIMSESDLYQNLSQEEMWVLKYFQTAVKYAHSDKQEMLLVKEFKKEFEIDVHQLESNLINGWK